MSGNPTITPELREQMEDVIATGVCTYTLEFTRELFPDFVAPEAQDCVVGGIARAVTQYEKTTGRPIALALALALLDTTKT